MRGSADVLDAIRVGKAQVAVEAVAHIVAIENVRVPAERKQLALQPLATVDLPEPERPVNHKQQGFCPLSCARSALVTSEACQETFVAPDFGVIGMGTEDLSLKELGEPEILALVAEPGLGMLFLISNEARI